jgi:manganese-dependent inorganic pyrophosphatase
MKKNFPKALEPQIFISGHKNPDIDSLAAASALAVLRQRLGEGNYIPICPGVLNERARYLYERFNITPPVCRNDVYIQVGDLISEVEAISGELSLFEAVSLLRENRLPRLPVVDKDNVFLGTLSGLALLSNLLSIGGDADGGSGLTGRRMFSSIKMICKVLNSEVLTGDELDKEQDFEVYVAAMSGDTFEEHLPQCVEKLAVIVGDRPDVQMRCVERKVRLMIITGNCPVKPWVLRQAQENKVSIILTQLDSAASIRRLKFSVPVRAAIQREDDDLILSVGDRLRDVRKRIVESHEDVIPVLENDGTLAGVILKQRLHETPPYRMILVDHNEIEQSPPGAEEIPVIEVVDHHRIGMMPTAVPIRFTGDVVGSTCTLVAQMYRSAGERLTPEMAGLLLGGVVSDTLALKSPTTSDMDLRICEWLEKLSGVNRDDLMNELLRIDSALAVKPALEVISVDRKDYSDGKIKFALSQVEETNLELLTHRLEELSSEITRVIDDEKLDFFGLLVTDAVRGNSEFLAFGDNGIIRNIPYQRKENGIFLLPGVLSRKKQLLPQILSITASLQDHF